MKLSPTAESLFMPLTPSQRASAPADYLVYLAGREGRLDFPSRSLAHREPFFEGLVKDPVRSELPLDRPLFRRNHDASTPDAGLSRDMLWLLAVAKANRTEHFGMEVHIVVNGILDGDRAGTQAYVDMQEVYHTRILLEVLRCFDLEVTVGQPDLATRVLVHAMVRLPHRVAGAVADGLSEKPESRRSSSAERVCPATGSLGGLTSARRAGVTRSAPGGPRCAESHPLWVRVPSHTTASIAARPKATPTASLRERRTERLSSSARAAAWSAAEAPSSR